MRLRHLDFLRGIAVLLVLLRHYALADILYQIGWMGVDLFFVLSGFLVSGLLFSEYKKYGNIKPGLFLIRRGFKIYPLFYTAISLTIVVSLLYNYLGWTNDEMLRGGLAAELVFLQNYFGHLWDHTWSLAVEEHFYFGLVALVFFFTKKKLLSNRKLFTAFFLVVALLCLSFRIITHIYLPFDNNTHIYPTHLRIDSLLFGVFLSYYYSFHRDKFTGFFLKYRVILLIIAFSFTITPFVFKIDTFFMNTFGLTMLYLGFGVIMSIMMINVNIDKTLNRYFGKWPVDVISRVGFYSYSIYLWHMIILKYVLVLMKNIIPFIIPDQIIFLVYFFSSIFFAMGISKLIELKFLSYRDKHFPSRAKALLQNPS